MASPASRAPVQAIVKLRKYSILIHRWMGVLFCLLFLMWFASGIVMMYWDYPDISTQERLARSQPLASSLIRISPQEAARSLDLDRPPDQMRLTMLDGRPVYRIRAGRTLYVVYADTGGQFEELSPGAALRVAAAWTGQAPSAARFLGLNEEEDQWTVSQAFRALRPMFVYSWPDGETVYVSSVTGEVVQHTTRTSRLGAYFGAIPHWLYFTPLRKNGALWNNVVVWSSGIGTLMSLTGIVVGLWMISPSKRYRFPDGRSSIPYAGQKRWHTMLGLFFGLVTCTWVFSGMLSMEPFEALSGGRGDPRVAAALRGRRIDLASFAARPPADTLALLSGLPVKELEFINVAGEPMYLALADGAQSRLIPVDGAPTASLDQRHIADLVARAVEPVRLAETRLVTQYEAYYLARHNERPLPVVFVRLSDAENSMYYIDPRSGRVVSSYVAASRWNRWLYHGLHSMDLPWLYRHRPAWDLAVLALMLGGTSLSVTAVIIAWRRLRQKASIRRASVALRKRGA
jgi:hypothetical protein